MGRLRTNDVQSWRTGYGVIRHSEKTLWALDRYTDKFLVDCWFQDEDRIEGLIKAADLLANAAMWTIAHMTYAKRVNLDGTLLGAGDFKRDPQGHMGGSLNMAIAFSGYLLANALSGHTRGWSLGQGHCVSAIEAINVLTGDVSDAQRERYPFSEQGLNRLVADYYSYALASDGKSGVPLGSHVSVHTAGAISEGGYLGFSGLQYTHMPLKGERLVAFLSDGAFEEQRGSDWSPRWWREEDSGHAVPVMILNGNRIEQRTQIAQEGDEDWLLEHLKLGGFDPILIDGHDPLAYALAILEADRRLEAFVKSGNAYPAPLPYIVAKCEKGFGFYGAGNLTAHNLPLDENPRENLSARKRFQESATRLFVPQAELEAAISCLMVHQEQHRQKESQNPMANRNLPLPVLPEPIWVEIGPDTFSVPMNALDAAFVSIADANPGLRVRIGNPDELASNSMGKTLARFKHRVNHPEVGAQENVMGDVITALNEEAVICAALGNKGGLNLAVSYEAFAVKMLGALRQEIIFARRQKEVGRPPRWISVPLIVSSHTWENAKNEQSHQDPTLSEALLGEMSDVSRVLFPVDTNTATATLRNVYASHGIISCIVAPKKPVKAVFDGPTAEEAVQTGAAHLFGNPYTQDIQLIAVGAYQLQEAIKAHARLSKAGISCCVTALIEPGRFRTGRDHVETEWAHDDKVIEQIFPTNLPRVLISHTRPEPLLGCLRRIDTGPDKMKALGYRNRGGTLDVFGMMFANSCTWAHIVLEVETILGRPETVLSGEETIAVQGQGDPQCLRL